MTYTVELLPTAREPGCPFDPPRELRQARASMAPSADTPSPADTRVG